MPISVSCSFFVHLSCLLSFTLFPYTTLFRSYIPFHALKAGDQYLIEDYEVSYAPSASVLKLCRARHTAELQHRGARRIRDLVIDRKSTHLNSSHLGTSYAVFCLKKK